MLSKLWCHEQPGSKQPGSRAKAWTAPLATSLQLPHYPSSHRAHHCCLQPACLPILHPQHPALIHLSNCGPHDIAHFTSASSQTKHTPKTHQALLICKPNRQDAHQVRPPPPARPNPAMPPQDTDRMSNLHTGSAHSPARKSSSTSRAQIRYIPLPLILTINNHSHHQTTPHVHACMLTPQKGLQNQRARRRKGGHPPGPAAPHLRRQADVRFLLLCSSFPHRWY